MTGSPYNAVHIEGGLLSADLIERIRSAARDLPGNRPEDYHLAAGERIGEAASRKWDYLKGAYRAFRERLDALPPTDSAVTETRERWLLRLFDELGFGRLTYLRGGIPAGRRPIRSPTSGASTSPSTSSAGTPIWTARRRPTARPAAPRSRCSRSSSTPATRTCGLCCPTDGSCASCGTRPRSSVPRTCSSTWKPSSTATCTRSSCSSSPCCTRRALNCCPATTAATPPSPTAGWNAGVPTASKPAAAPASNCGATWNSP